jgi:hypothetical protein
VGGRSGQKTRIVPCGRRLSRSSLVPRLRAITDAPLAGAVTRIPGKLLHAIRVPAFTSAIVASAPMTVIDPGVIASVAEGEAAFFADPQPATTKPRTARNANTTTRFTWPFIAPGRPDVNMAHRDSACPGREMNRSPACGAGAPDGR